MRIKPKKHLGQHFLVNTLVAQNIVDALVFDSDSQLLEVGPGKGILTGKLLKKWGDRMKCIEIDARAVQFLQDTFPNSKHSICFGDFLKIPLGDIFDSPVEPSEEPSEEEGVSPFLYRKIKIIGNFPYNISTQIFFKILEYKNEITEVVCMLQKEVAHRLATPPGKRACGILSVLVHLWYKVDYLFEVDPIVFAPPPKVQSAVIRLTRNTRTTLPVEYFFFKKMIKRAFNNRRKTLRNALKILNLPNEISGNEIFSLRAEQLSLNELLSLAETISSYQQSPMNDEQK